MSNEEREPQGFLEKDRSRRNKKDRSRDGGKRIRNVGTANTRWRFDPSKFDDEDAFYDEDEQG